MSDRRTVCRKLIATTMTEEKFIGLLVRHESELRGFARSLMPFPADADDLMQEACLAMWRKFGTLRDSGAFRSWAHSYLRLTALNMRRKRQRSPLVFSEETIEVLADEWQELGDLPEVKSRALADCSSELTDKQRKLLAAYYQTEKTTVRDLSEKMQRPMDGIRKALGRIRAILKVCIQEKLRREGYVE